jgi:hypothetical protein
MAPAPFARRVLGACLLALGGVALAVACAPRPRMCAAVTECPSAGVCVAGRCQPGGDAGGTPTIAEQGDAGPLVRRLVVAPVDVAWLRRGDGVRAATEMPAIFPLGRASDGSAVLLTRFAVPLAKETQIIEAYLLLARTDAVDADPTPVSLHAMRIVDAWDSRSVSWSTQPRTEEAAAAVTRVAGASRTLVRLDVRPLVARWILHDRRDQGIAVVAEGASATGIPFAFLPTGAVRPPSPAIGVQPPAIAVFQERPERSAPNADGSTAELLSPRLELYVK